MKANSKSYAFARFLLFRYAARIEAFCVERRAKRSPAVVKSSELVASNAQIPSPNPSSLRQITEPENDVGRFSVKPEEISDEDYQPLTPQSTNTENKTSDAIGEQRVYESSGKEDCQTETLHYASEAQTQEHTIVINEDGSQLL